MATTENKYCSQCAYCRQRLIEGRFGLERYSVWVCTRFEIKITPNERACGDFISYDFFS